MRVDLVERLEARTDDAVILRRDQHIAADRQALRVARAQLGILASDDDQVVREGTGRIQRRHPREVGAERQQAAGGGHILDDDVRTHVADGGNVPEVGLHAVTDIGAVDVEPGDVVIGREDDLAIDDARALRRIEAEIAAEDHADRIGLGRGDPVDHVVVGAPVARRAADIAVELHHRAAGRRADRDRDVEQPVGQAEVHHLARDIGMTAVDPRRAQHLHIGRNHREERVFRQRADLRAGADPDLRGRARCALQRHVAAGGGEALEARHRRFERGQHQAAHIEHRIVADQDAGGRIERHEPARHLRAAHRIGHARQHRAVDDRDIAVGGGQDAVEHREIGELPVLEQGRGVRRQEIERVAVAVLDRSPVDHRRGRGDVHRGLPRRGRIDRGAATDDIARGIDRLRARCLGGQREGQRQCRAAAADQQARTVPDGVRHLSISTGTGGRSAKTGSAHRLR